MGLRHLLRAPCRLGVLLPGTYLSRIDIVVGRVGAAPRTPEEINPDIQPLTSDVVLRSVILQSHLASADPASRKQADTALRRLQVNLAVTAFKGPDVVEITYQATTPGRAVEILRNIAAAYANTHRVHPVVPASAARLGRMAAANRARLRLARTDLARFVSAQRLPPPPPQAARQRMEARDATQRALLRRVADLQSLDRSLHAHVAEARLVERLDAQAISTPGSMEPSPAQLVSAPPRAFLVLCGLLASLLVGAATALALELLSDRLRTRSSVEQATGVPVLASIPSNAVAPAFQNAFPALYLAMQRPVNAFEGKLS